MRCGVYLLATLLCVAMNIVVLVIPQRDASRTQLYLLMAGVLAAVLVVIALGVVLVLNGFVMIRREGRRLVNLLGLFLGLLILAYIGLGITGVFSDDFDLIIWLLFMGFPLAYLGFGFTSYLLYAFCYLWVTRRWAKPPVAVLVLGSGLIRNRVPPLLASRLDTGMRIAQKAIGSGHQPVYVVSGGKGSDEQRSEASAMAEYLVDKGIDSGTVLQEDLSKTTRENIANTKVILSQAGITGRVATVTNNFHAFRAALLMRREKVPGYAIGAPTARYYWPAAVIREFVGVMRETAAFNIVCLCLSVLPLLVWTVTHLVG